MSATLSGRCLCGAIEFSVVDDFRYSGYCHCSDCRRFSGSASSAMAGTIPENLRIIQGQDHIATYAKSEDTVLAFCRTCGSSLYALKPRRHMVHLRLGTLNEAPSLAPQFHSYVGSKAPWDHINDDLPQFNAGRPPPSTSS